MASINNNTLTVIDVDSVYRIVGNYLLHQKYTREYVLVHKLIYILTEFLGRFSKSFDFYLSGCAIELPIIDKARINIFWLYDYPYAFSLDYLSQFDVILCSSPYYANILAKQIYHVVHVWEHCTSCDNITNITKKTIPIVYIDNYAKYKKVLLDINKDIVICGTGWEQVTPKTIIPINYYDSLHLYRQSILTLDLMSSNAQKLGFVNHYIFDAIVQQCLVLSNVQNYLGVLKNCIINIDEHNINKQIEKVLNNEQLRDFFLQQYVAIAHQCTYQERAKQLLYYI